MRTSSMTPLLLSLTILALHYGHGHGHGHSGRSLRASVADEESFIHRLLQFDDPHTAEQFAPPHEDDNNDNKAIGASSGKTSYPPLDDTTIRNAVHDWVTSSDKTSIIAQYGPIGNWDVSRVSDMSHLFTNARFFNEDLSQWNVSGVTDMSYMFAFCSSFDSSLENWDTRRVTDMSFAFHHATQFEGRGLVHWDVSRVRDLTYFVQGASNFQENIWRWHTGNVLKYNRAFHNATKFSEQLCWELHPQAQAVQTFCGTRNAFFSCDPNDALKSDLNQQYYECCDCEYTSLPMEYDGSAAAANANGDGDDKKTGVILASVIWIMVFLMLVVVIGITMRRRREVQQWIQSKLSSTSSTTPPPPELAPDGVAIATFVGPARSCDSSGGGSDAPQHIQSPNNHHASATTTTTTTTINTTTDIPMVTAGISTPHVTTHANNSNGGPAWAQASYPTYAQPQHQLQQHSGMMEFAT